MIAMVCMDDNGGTMFHHRRQSKDKVLRAEMLGMLGKQKLKLSPYSAKQFEAEAQVRLDAAEDFLDTAQYGDFCFVEGLPLAPYEDKLEQVILFRWNRTYPADTYFDLPLREHGWTLVESCDFAGSSHEKITKEIYNK